jgi:hypothetical protein
MPPPNESKWKGIAERYLDLWNLPNCIGSIDGKHIRVKCIPETGSLCYNYKDNFSVILLAYADADALSTTVHVGDFGKNSDGSVFRASTLGGMLEKEELHIPFPASLPLDDSGETFPYNFVADEAFPFKINLIKFYRRRMLTNKRRMFNYRLSRARKSIEYAFGILNTKFNIFERPICCKEEAVNLLIKTSVVLHNFIRSRERLFCEGAEMCAVNKSSHLTLNYYYYGRQKLLRAQHLRNQLADYFLKPADAVSSKWSYFN